MFLVWKTENIFCAISGKQRNNKQLRISGLFNGIMRRLARTDVEIPGLIYCPSPPLMPAVLLIYSSRVLSARAAYSHFEAFGLHLLLSLSSGKQSDVSGPAELTAEKCALL